MLGVGVILGLLMHGCVLGVSSCCTFSGRVLTCGGAVVPFCAVRRLAAKEPLPQAPLRDVTSEDEDALPTLSLSDCALCSTEGAADVWRDHRRTGVVWSTPDCPEGPLDGDNVIDGEDIVRDRLATC